MSSDRNERFSDLELARALTRHLRGGAGARAEPHGKASKLVEPRPHYIRFDGQKLVPDAEALFGGRGPRARFGPDTWNALLDGALSAADAETAFLMDAQGLVVACRGGRPAEEVEGIGARLLLTLDHAEQMASAAAPTRSVLVELSGSWLAGIRVKSKGGPALTVCVLGARPLATEAREVIEGLLLAACPTE
jgi:hypothetical protein